MLRIVKPRIGLLGLSQIPHNGLMPEVPLTQERLMRDLVRKLEEVADIEFPGISARRKDTEKIIDDFNCGDIHVILVVNLSTASGMDAVPAFKKNRLPVMLANIQPNHTITMDWEWNKHIANQGISGLMDTANMLVRMGYMPAVATDDWRSDSFLKSFAGWSRAASVTEMIAKARLAVFGKANNTGDILGDELAFYRKLGIDVTRIDIGKVIDLAGRVIEGRIGEQAAENDKNFNISNDVPREKLRAEARMQIALERVLDEGGFAGFSINYDLRSDDRLTQYPVLAASNLMAKGYAYSTEGDVYALALGVIGNMLIGGSYYTSAYSMDFARNACVLGNPYGANWKLAKAGQPVEVVDKQLGTGRAENPLSLSFAVSPGVATVASFVPINGDYMRMVAMRGEVLDERSIIKGVPMNYLFFTPYVGVKKAMNDWLRLGGSHHQVLWMGDHMGGLQMLCDQLDIELVEV